MGHCDGILPEFSALDQQYTQHDCRIDSLPTYLLINTATKNVIKRMQCKNHVNHPPPPDLHRYHTAYQSWRLKLTECANLEMGLAYLLPLGSEEVDSSSAGNGSL